MGAVIEVEDLTKSFGGYTAVDGLNLTVEEGCIMGFIGPNGAGKTTTIRLLLGLLRPDCGSGKIFGLDIIRDSVEIRKHIGYVPEVDQLYGYMTVQEIMDFNKEFYAEWNADLVERYIDFFGLSTGAKVAGLSHGMKKQLALILALAPEPELLLFDEPTSGLDPINRQEFLRIILEEISTRGKTVLYSTHLLGDVERVADRVAVINKGKKITCRPIDELKAETKRIRVVFQHQIDPKIFSFPGITGYRCEGKTYIVDVNDNLTEVLRHLKNQPHFTLDVIDRNLEEIFIDTVRGDQNERDEI